MGIVRTFRRAIPRKLLTVDPAGCRCVQCIVGDSVPAQLLRESQKNQIVDDNNVRDRTGYTEREWERWLA